MSEAQLPTTRRTPPFSIRFTAEEQERLDRDRQGMRRAPYIKAKVFGGTALKSAAAIADRPALAQALALLGQSRFASNLNQIAHLAHIGALTFTPEEQAELSAALRHVAEIRSLLLSALGKKTGDLS
jgi:hypothetical protein